MINPDFILALQRSRTQYDLVWKILDRITKLTHFFLVKTTLSPEDYAQLYLQEVVRLYAVFHTIIQTEMRNLLHNFVCYSKKARVQRLTFVLPFILR